MYMYYVYMYIYTMYVYIYPVRPQRRHVGLLPSRSLNASTYIRIRELYVYMHAIHTYKYTYICIEREKVGYANDTRSLLPI
jgi:hypothetical protein